MKARFAPETTVLLATLSLVLVASIVPPAGSRSSPQLYDPPTDCQTYRVQVQRTMVCVDSGEDSAGRTDLMDNITFQVPHEGGSLAIVLVPTGTTTYQLQLYNPAGRLVPCGHDLGTVDGCLVPHAGEGTWLLRVWAPQKIGEDGYVLTITIGVL